MATKAEKLVAKGRALAEKGKPAKALECYRDACKVEPYDPEVWVLRSDAAHGLGLHGEAAESLFHVCELYARSGMIAPAHATARKVLAIDPSHGGARRLAKMFEARVAAMNAPPEPEPEPELPPAEPEPPVIEMEALPPEPVPEPVPAPAQEAARLPLPPAAEPLGKRRHTVMVPVVPMPIAPKPWAEVKPELPLAAAVAARSEEASDFVFDPTDRGLEDLSLAELTHDGKDVQLEEPQIDVLQAVASTISTSPLLSELDSDLVRHLIEAGRLVTRETGQLLFRQGEIGTSLYLVLQGEVAVERDEAGAPPRELARLRAGAFFGEMALLTNMPRSATVRATSTAFLLEVSRRAVRQMIERDRRVLKLLMRFFRARLVGTHLQTSELFRGFSREEKRRLVARFRLREVAADQVVVREGQHGEGLFMVLVGRLDVTQSTTTPHTAGTRRTRKTTHGHALVLGELAQGDVFGEMSLLEGNVAMATVRTSTRSWLLLLPAGDFHELSRQHPQVREHLALVAARRREQNRAVVAAALREDHVEPV
jgi:CRP-like cAMP-binding protein